MIATGLLHLQSWHWNVIAWMFGFFVIAIGAVAALVITVLLLPGRPRPLERSLFAFGIAALGPPALFASLRIAELVEPAFGPGPQHWLIGWIPGMRNHFVHPYDTVVALHLVSAGCISVIAVLVALLFPPGPRWRPPLPGREVAAALLGLCAAVIPFLAWRVYVVDQDGARLLEWVAMTPSLCVALGLRAFAQLPLAPTTSSAPSSPEPAPRPVDPRARWSESGLLDPKAAPLWVVEASERAEPAMERAERAWQAVDAPGKPPRALDELLERIPLSRDLFVVGDIPADAEQALLTALLADLVGSGGLRVLLIHPRPRALVEALEEALRRARTWAAGASVVGPDAFHEALAGHQLPALVAVRPDAFGDRLIRMANREAQIWVRGLDLLIVHRPDRGTPIRATHTAFVFRRWAIATRRLGQPPVLVTLPDTPTHRAFAERLFPGRDTHRIGYTPRTVGTSVAWPGHEPAAESAVPWLVRAAEAVSATGLPVGVFDPAGRWGKELFPPGVTLHREPDWRFPASVAELGPGDLVEAIGTFANRLPKPDQHVSLWSLPDDPVARFLHPGRLDALTREGRLPRPAPVVGSGNRFLRLAHFDVALRESTVDEHTLRWAFGDDIVDFRLRTTTEPATRCSTFSAWREGDEVLRSPHLRGAGSAVQPHSHTVTNDVVEVVEERTSEILLEVDARTVATRFYPKRVFAVGQRRFQVPMHAYDTKRGKLKVRLARERDRLTRPVMSFELELRRLTVDRVTRRHGAFQMHTLSGVCLVRERVHAAWVPGEDREERFGVVESTYDTEVRFVLPERARKGLGLFHLAAVLEALLPVFLRCSPDDAAVIPVRAGFFEGMGAGIAVVDRFIGGMGFAAALDDTAIQELLTWVRSSLYECPCMDGCRSCTPPQVMRVGPAKQEVLSMLEGL